MSDFDELPEPVDPVEEPIIPSADDTVEHGDDAAPPENGGDTVGDGEMTDEEKAWLAFAEKNPDLAEKMLEAVAKEDDPPPVAKEPETKENEVEGYIPVEEQRAQFVDISSQIDDAIDATKSEMAGIVATYNAARAEAKEIAEEYGLDSKAYRIAYQNAKALEERCAAAKSESDKHVSARKLVDQVSREIDAYPELAKYQWEYLRLRWSGDIRPGMKPSEKIAVVKESLKNQGFKIDDKPRVDKAKIADDAKRKLETFKKLRTRVGGGAPKAGVKPPTKAEQEAARKNYADKPGLDPAARAILSKDWSK